MGAQVRPLVNAITVKGVQQHWQNVHLGGDITDRNSQETKNVLSSIGLGL